MKIAAVLSRINMSLNSLNEELKKLGIPEVHLNSKLSDEDFYFLIEYFESNEYKEIERLRCLIANHYRSLELLFLKRNQNPHIMGEMEKRQLFRLIKEKEQSNPLCPKGEYSAENFWAVYNWYYSWLNKTPSEQEDELYELYEDDIDDKETAHSTKIIVRDVIDWEGAIMSGKVE